MRKLCLIPLLALAAPALAQELSEGMTLGTTSEEVEASLAEMGYEIRKSEMEDGKIEVYFVRDGEMGEVYVNTETGQIDTLEMEG